MIDGNDGHDLLIAGDVTLAMLTMLYPTWAPPANAQSLIDSDDYIQLWDDIIEDVGFA